ncbi:hypothetical protein BO71DRAFT_435277 [Aspergillus ellipticus CBS 707.79]|uniref:Uncharacterized protein n=1 Tax=Aspergillus ellipticus CBS 707.79 TaxID=1448320 RepID=A0A319CW95_9EURO|nr:hypothetical protein BO71DRAFT_435277 [Aspergillus ellipticus CBS 707.79]
MAGSSAMATGGSGTRLGEPALWLLALVLGHPADGLLSDDSTPHPGCCLSSFRHLRSPTGSHMAPNPGCEIMSVGRHCEALVVTAVRKRPYQGLGCRISTSGGVEAVRGGLAIWRGLPAVPPLDQACWSPRVALALACHGSTRVNQWPSNQLHSIHDDAP